MGYSNNYLGVYRAIVVDNKDPEKRGRIKVYCPSIMDEFLSNWCVPCVSFSDTIWNLPQINSSIWITFEEGDINKPIWLGGWYIPNNSPVNSEIIEKQEKNWDKMILQPDNLPVKNLEGNLENYFGYKTPFGGFYWKKNFDDTLNMLIDFDNWGKIFAYKKDDNDVKLKICAEGVGEITLDKLTNKISIKGNNIDIEATNKVNIKGAEIHLNDE